MNGGQDLGGMQGFGPVIDDGGEPHFHSDWEPRVMAMVVALGATGQWNIDESRHARESLPPGDYLSFPYYRIWLEGVQALMLERGMVGEEELSDGVQRTPAIEVTRCLSAEDVPAVLARGGPADRPETSQPALQVGDRVRTTNLHPTGHTRLPRYARARTGTVTAVLGHHVYPDSSGNGGGEAPTWLYQVRFTAAELWGKSAHPDDAVTLDLWEPHLERL